MRENARRASCQSNLKQLGLAFVQYTQDSDEKYPACSSANYWNTEDWAGPIYTYVKSKGVYTCPDDSTAATSPAVALSYGLNANFAPPTGGIALSQLQASANTVELFEVVKITGDPSTDFFGVNASATGDGTCGTGYNGGQYATGVFPNVTNTASSPYLALTGRHSDGSNFLLADGHVKWLRATSVSAGHDNATAGDGGGTGASSSGGCTTATNGNFVGNIAAANTGNSSYTATFSTL